ncbi:TPA: nucleotidyltransferase family protein [Candidatus Poribacteria bacterium]|nr:nucleotidyltransferase family protein [Candidatus Poribacteria bacterium]
MIRKAVIIAGGMGTRLRPVTYEIPKPLIPIRGRTLTEHVLDILKDAGVVEVFLSVGYMHERIRGYFGDGARFGVRMRYIIEDKPLGTGGWMKLIEPFQEHFIALNGDNLFDLDFREMYRFHLSRGAVATIALTKVDDPRAYGVVTMEGDRITAFLEKSDRPPTDLINSGYYIFSPSVFRYLPPSSAFMLERDLFPKLAEEGVLCGFIHDGTWFDTGTFERWEAAIRGWRRKEQEVRDG